MSVEESQLRRRARLSLPILLFSLVAIAYFGADNLFSSVPLRELRSTEWMVALAAVYLALFFWVEQPPAKVYLILAALLILTAIFAWIFLFFALVMLVILAGLVPVAVVLFVIVSLSAAHTFAYRNRRTSARLKALRIETATLCLFMAFYMLGLGHTYETRTVFVTVLPVADRTYHLYFIPPFFGDEALELHECNQYSFACHRVYVEDLAYDQAAPFSLTVDAGEIVILANGDPVYWHPLP
jgi:hypothetical protein